MFFEFKREIKASLDIKPERIIGSRPTLKEILKKGLQAEEDGPRWTLRGAGGEDPCNGESTWMKLNGSWLQQ